MTPITYNPDHYRSARKATLHRINSLGWKGSYRNIFKQQLADQRYAEAQAAEEAAWLASLPPVPPEVEEEAARLREMAAACSITVKGNAEYRDLMNQAQWMIDEARGL